MICQWVVLKKPGIAREKVSGKESKAIQLNRNILFDVSHASQNPQLSAAVNVDLDNPLGDWNKPCIVLSSTANVPDNMAWGVKEVLYIDPNAVIIRITGCKSDGVNTAVWTGVYNHGSWSGWSEH